MRGGGDGFETSSRFLLLGSLLGNCSHVPKGPSIGTRCGSISDVHVGSSSGSWTGRSIGCALGGELGAGSGASVRLSGVIGRQEVGSGASSLRGGSGARVIGDSVVGVMGSIQTKGNPNGGGLDKVMGQFVGSLGSGSTASLGGGVGNGSKISD
jgi:hypothetical protein